MRLVPLRGRGAPRPVVANGHEDLHPEGALDRFDADAVRLGEIRGDKGSGIVLTSADLLYLFCTCTGGFYRFSPMSDSNH